MPKRWRACTGSSTEREARAVPHSLVGRLDAALAVPLRSDAAAPLRQVDLRIETEDGRKIELRSGDEPAQRRILSDGRAINERMDRTAGAADGPSSAVRRRTRLRTDDRAADRLSP